MKNSWKSLRRSTFTYHGTDREDLWGQSKNSREYTRYAYSACIFTLTP